jgi:hypothetical protein
VFDGEEFASHVAHLQEFQVILMNALQKSGQTAFYVAYEDLRDVEVMNGLAKYLGSEERLESLDGKLKRQNPSPISEKVSNYEDVPAAMAALDRFNLNRTPNFEPRRGAAVPSYVAAKDAGLLFMPMQGGPTQAVMKWLGDVVGGSENLISNLNQRQLRHWKSVQDIYRSFTVLRHPVARAHEVFCTKILSDGEGSFRKIRRTLRNRFGLPIPESMEDATYSADDHRIAFLAFLEWLQANLNGQTAIRQDAHWVAQASLLEGFSGFQAPDFVFREDELGSALPQLAEQVGATAVSFEPQAAPLPFTLSEIYDADIEKRAQMTYARDYEAFGFKNWC